MSDIQKKNGVGGVSVIPGACALRGAVDNSLIVRWFDSYHLKKRVRTGFCGFFICNTVNSKNSNDYFRILGETLCALTRAHWTILFVSYSYLYLILHFTHSFFTFVYRPTRNIFPIPGDDLDQRKFAF